MQGTEVADFGNYPLQQDFGNCLLMGKSLNRCFGDGTCAIK